MWEICLTSKGQWDSWRYFLERCVHLSNTAKYWNRNFISWDIYFLWKTNTLGCEVRFIHLQFPEIAKTCQAVTRVLKIICWVQHFILVGSVIAEGWVLHSFLQQNFQQRFLLSKVNKILYNSVYYVIDSFLSLHSRHKKNGCIVKEGGTAKECSTAVMVQHTELMGKSWFLFW